MGPRNAIAAEQVKNPDESWKNIRRAGNGKIRVEKDTRLNLMDELVSIDREQSRN